MNSNLTKLTLEEKLRLLTGQDTWRTYNANGKLKQIFVSDGPNGLRMINEDNTTKKATAMPNLVVVANSWNTKTAFLDGETIANECIANGADVILGPGVNIKRTPLCGRNFEYCSEDPFLAGNIAKAYIEGVQSKGVGTSLKHYFANNREYDRLFQTSELDERSMREIYLANFEIALQAKPWTVMCSYNLINGIYASENKYALTDLLRDEFGYEGTVVSDWGAVHNQFRRVRAGLDLEMPFTEKSYDDLKAAYDKGLITDEQIDRSADRILNLIDKAFNDKKTINYDAEQRHENAVRIAEDGIVLLKNEQNILPLKSKNICVNGQFAYEPTIGGGGSAFVETAYKQKNLADLINQASNDQCKATYNNKTYVSPWLGVTNIKDAFLTAYHADIAVVCVGTNTTIEGEGFDRTTLRLPITEEQLILGTAEANENVVVVVYAGSAIDMSPWIDKVKAVVFAGFGGEAVNEAVANILVGKVCPSGKLSETFPLCLEDTYCENETGNGCVEQYPDGIFVGYRYYDAMQADVLFPFGHGISYANFTYSDLTVNKINETEYEVSYNITNNSDIDAQEVSQLYVKDVFCMVSRPPKELKGFSKDLIKAHSTKRVTLKLDARSFAYYSTNLKKWYVENGDFEILVGASSRDIRLKAKIQINLPEEEQFSCR